MSTSVRPAAVAPLSDPDAVPLVGPEAVDALGRVVVVAPHPDDESLGCGGLVAHLADRGRSVRVVVVTDGTRSHVSETYPPLRLRAVREAEARSAVRALAGGGRVDVSLLRYPDCGLPQTGTPAFSAAVDSVSAMLRGWAADTLVVPWRRDPHCDHEGTWALFTASAHRLEAPPRIVEYPVWAWTRVGEAEAPRAGEGRPWRLDVSGVLDRKRRAVAAHVSQTTRLIDDDPDGFILTPDVLAHFDRPYEIYLDA